jgi:glutamate-1-semialdehyde 2,1-aminomutase
LKFDGCYHGHVDSLLVKSGSGLAGESSSSSAGVSESVAHETLVAPLDHEPSLEKILQERGREIAAVIIEPLPANYGLLPQRQEFLQTLVKLARAQGALVIFDEVISGFRVAKGGMAEILGIQPDLVSYGKVIGGGFPVGAYGGRKDLMDLVAPLGPVYQAGTLSANPVGMRAGLATLKKIKRLDGWNQLNKHGTELADKLRAVFVKTGAKLEVASFGSLFWIHQPTGQTIRALNQIPKGQGEAFRGLFLECLDQGLYLAPNAYEVGFVSLAHTPDILQTTADIIQAALQKGSGG